jgi:hypothetical protein
LPQIAAFAISKTGVGHRFNAKPGGDRGYYAA